LINGCAFKSIIRDKNITYLNASGNKVPQTLNIFSPKKNQDLKPVFIFIHGGNWNSGKKSIYNFLGTRMSRKGIVTVIPDYPKSPSANFIEMADDVALAVKWVKENISKFGGDSNRIFISGHSAGGHLAALVTIKKEYFEKINIANPLKGLVLIDAAGLDMYNYMKEEGSQIKSYTETFTNDTALWKQASPIYFLHSQIPPMLIYRGGRTYESISTSNEKFITALKKQKADFTYSIQKNKKHVPMILQFFNSNNKRYGEMIRFMKVK
jgi:acetyl esterase/lipase